MAGGLSTQEQQALLKALSSPSPNYSGPLGEPSYPSGVLSSGAYAPWAGIGDFQPTPMFQMQGPQVSYSNPNTGFTQYMADLLKAEEEAAAAETIRNIIMLLVMTIAKVVRLTLIVWTGATHSVVWERGLRR